ncbi:MAG: prepilin-type N-terminal cleavage/methylation domain-containing protein [Gemmataceae bacterium]
MHQRNTIRTGRAGFTLAEMLMAIAIIAVLVALSAYAVLRFSDTGPYNATVANLGKIQAALDTQWQAVKDRAMRDSLHGFEGKEADLGVTKITDADARKNYVERSLAKAFPISFAEALDPNKLGAYGPYNTYLRTLLGLTANENSTRAQSCAPPQVQQAICLMMILERGPGNAGLTADKLEGGSVQRLDLRNASGGSVQASGIVDGWGRPVMFTRNYQAETGSPRLNQLVLVSTGALRGRLKPWGRVLIPTANPPTFPTPLGPESDWESNRAWNPTPLNHTLKTQPGQVDEPVTTYKP